MRTRLSNRKPYILSPGAFLRLVVWGIAQVSSCLDGKVIFRQEKAVLSISAGNAGVNSAKEIQQQKLGIISCLYSVTNLLVFLYGSAIVSKFWAVCYILLLLWNLRQCLWFSLDTATGPGTYWKAMAADLREPLCPLPHTHNMTSDRTFLGCIYSSGNPYHASAGFTRVVTLWYRYQDERMLVTHVRSSDKNCDLQVKIRMIH